MGSGRAWLAGDWPSTGGAFSRLLRRPGLRASSDGVLATKSERKFNVSEYMLVLALCLVHNCISRLTLLSVRPAVTFPASERHRRLERLFRRTPFELKSSYVHGLAAARRLLLTTEE